MVRNEEFNSAEPIIVGLVGMKGVGKSALAGGLQGMAATDIDPYLGEEGLSDVQSIRMRDVISWYHYAESPHAPHLTMREVAPYHQTVRERGDAEALLAPLQKLRAGIFIVDALHHEEDAAIFKKNGWFLLGLKADFDTCIQRVINDDNDEKHQVAIDDFLAHIKTLGVPTDETSLEVMTPHIRQRKINRMYAEFAEQELEIERRQQTLAADDVPHRRSGLAAQMALVDATIDANVDKTTVASHAVEAIRSFATLRRQVLVTDLLAEAL